MQNGINALPQDENYESSYTSQSINSVSKHIFYTT